jgi:hypothetical protein
VWAASKCWYAFAYQALNGHSLVILPQTYLPQSLGRAGQRLRGQGQESQHGVSSVQVDDVVILSLFTRLAR